MKYLLISLCMLFSLVARGQNQDESWYCSNDNPSVKTQWLDSELGIQKALIISPTKSGQNNALVVFIHGDSPFGDPVYQYNIARQISEIKGVTAAAILRPGYKDGCDDQSAGDKGLTLGDNYTQENVDAIALVIQSLQKELNPSKTIIMGHSGGAALTALLMQSHTLLAQQSILVACPCDLPKWRKSMQELTQYDQWSNPMSGLSPIEGLEEVDKNHTIQMYVGQKDVVTPPFLSEAFYQLAKTKDLIVELQILEHADHESILRKEMLTLILDKTGL